MMDVNDLRHKLRELETVILEPADTDMAENQAASLEPEKWKAMMEEAEVVHRGDLKQVLIACAKAISENDKSTTVCLMAKLRQMVSVCGEPIQRLGAYMLEGLVARLVDSGSSIYNTLKCKEPAANYILYDACPYFKFGYTSANGAIAEALKDENRIHIIDFHIAQGSQWISLIQALAGLRGGPPHLRITGIDDSESAYANNGGLLQIECSVCSNSLDSTT